MEESILEKNKTEKDEDTFLKIILKYSGLTLSASHRDFIFNFIQSRKKELSLTDEEYCRKLEEDIGERSLIIDEAAINETYFFREESQFDYLRDVYFPQHKDVVIWSVACSTGEEPISLYALAKSCNVNASVYASDIDQKALEKIKDRSYTSNSFRNEGSPYLNLLGDLGTYSHKSFTMSKDTLSRLNISKFNLATDDIFPMPAESVDLLFLRNVFIYFTSETRKAVLIKMAKAMKMHALLFLSVNEIASIECDSDMPFVKENCGSVYYLRKVNIKEKEKHTAKLTSRPVKPEKRETKKDAGLIQRTYTPFLQSSDDEALGDQCTISELYRTLKDALCSKEKDEAEKIISSHKFKAVEKEHEFYMKGIVYEARGNTSQALDSFQRACILNPKFWPASYSLAMLYKKNGDEKNMKKTFISCSKALESYIKNKEICYNEIVDSFSPDYFLELCELQSGKSR